MTTTTQTRVKMKHHVFHGRDGPPTANEFSLSVKSTTTNASFELIFHAESKVHRETTDKHGGRVKFEPAANASRRQVARLAVRLNVECGSADTKEEKGIAAHSLLFACCAHSADTKEEKGIAAHSLLFALSTLCAQH
jgi:hypothetical protein